MSGEILRNSKKYSLYKLKINKYIFFVFNGST